MFSIENDNREHCHWVLHISLRISLSIKFHLKLRILTVCNKFARKRYFRSKTKKMNIAIEFCIFHLVWTSSFILSDNFDSLDQICSRRVFPAEYKRREQHHRILHIRIRLGAIFLGAMALLCQSRDSWPSTAPLGQSRDSWPSTAPLDHVQNFRTKILWHF